MYLNASFKFCPEKEEVNLFEDGRHGLFVLSNGVVIFKSKDSRIYGMAGGEVTFSEIEKKETFAYRLWRCS